jgi:hypothetical protein
MIQRKARLGSASVCFWRPARSAGPVEPFGSLRFHDVSNASLASARHSPPLRHQLELAAQREPSERVGWL